MNGDGPSILASSWDPPPGWLCPSEFELAVAADRDKHPELPQVVTVVVCRRLCSCLRGCIVLRTSVPGRHRDDLKMATN